MQFISGGGANSVDKFRTQESNLDLALSMLKTTLLLNIILFLLNYIIPHTCIVSKHIMML